VSFYTYFLDKDTTLTGILKNKSYFSCVFARIFVPLQGILNNTHFLEQIKSTTMINRTLVRTKIIQTLFAYYKTDEHSPLSARKELLSSFSSTYSLYMALLAFADELTTYAENQLSANQARAAVLHQEYTPNRNFVNNRVAQQLFNNRRLRTYIEDQHLSWDTGMSAVESVYKQLIQAPFYIDYMQLESPTYEDDKRIWRKIYSSLLLNNDDLSNALEDMEIALDFQGWTNEVDLVLTYIDKTIKRFAEENGDEQVLLEMFNSEDELNFAKDLLRLVIENASEYKQLIANSLHNWEAERIAYMDHIILITAITEISHFNNIALEISMNEYIELAKEFSGEKSYTFINGILNNIVGQLKRENKIFKSVR
jgi:N utilization substance protein B